METDEESSLDLSGGELLQIDLSVLNPRNLVELNLSENKLSNIDFLFDENGESLCPSLSSLNVASNRLSKLTPNLTNLKNLKSLDASRNSLVEIVRKLSSMKKLEKLNFSSNKIDSFEPIKNLPSLIELRLDSNPVENFGSSMIFCRSLEILSLSNCDLLRSFPRISVDFFLEFSNLKIVDVSQNSLRDEFFHRKSSKNFSNLEKFFGSKNFFSKIENLFEISRRIVFADFSSNKIEFWPRNAPPTLLGVDLSSNNIDLKSVEENFPTKIDNFRFAENFLLEIPAKVLCAKNLTSLDLSGNRLTKLDENLSALRALKFFDASRNFLAQFPHFLTKKIREIRLDKNRLVSLGPNFAEFEHLESLDISNNFFLEFPPVLIFSKLKTLRFSQKFTRKIDSLPENFLEFRSLQRLDLSGNSFLEFPEVFYEMKNLTELDFSSNFVAKIDFDRLEHFKRLDLSQNLFNFFPPNVFRIENVKVENNERSIAPPNHFSEQNFSRNDAKNFAEKHFSFQQILQRNFQKIFLDFTNETDLERLARRLDVDFNKVRGKNRLEKVTNIFQIHQSQTSTPVDAFQLEKIAKTIADRNLLQQIQREKIFTQRIRI